MMATPVSSCGRGSFGELQVLIDLLPVIFPTRIPVALRETFGGVDAPLVVGDRDIHHLVMRQRCLGWPVGAPERRLQLLRAFLHALVEIVPLLVEEEVRLGFEEL